MVKSMLRLGVAAGLVAAGLAGAGFASSSCVPGTICSTTTTGSGSTTAQGAPPTTTGGSSHGGTTTSATATKPSVRPPTVTLSSRVINFGQKVKITGQAPLAAAGDSVEILSQLCGFTQPLVIAEAKVKSGGRFSFALLPTRDATFAARYVGLTSSFQRLMVKPAVALRRLSAGLFGVDVSVGNGTFFTKRAILQRYDAAHHRWRSAASGKLRANSAPEALVAVSSTKIRATVRRGSRIRASVPRATVGKCYLPASSRVVLG